MHSPDHKYIAYAADMNGSEYCVLKIRNLVSGNDLSDQIVSIQGDIVWSNDGNYLFYTVLDDNHRPCRVMRHRIGDSSSEDQKHFFYNSYKAAKPI